MAAGELVILLLLLGSGLAPEPLRFAGRVVTGSAVPLCAIAALQARAVMTELSGPVGMKPPPPPPPLNPPPPPPAPTTQKTPKLVAPKK